MLIGCRDPINKFLKNNFYNYEEININLLKYEYLFKK